MKYFNGYTQQEMTDSEVKGLKASDYAMVAISGTSVNLDTNKREVTSVLIFPHIGTMGTACHCYKCEYRFISDVARVIRQTWNPVWFGAVPYLEAMQYVSTADSSYGCEDGKTQVLYFLSNAAQWKGTIAKLIKMELKYYCGLK